MLVIGVQPTHAELREPLKMDMVDTSLAEAVTLIASLYKLSVVVPESATEKRVSIKVFGKDPVLIMKALAASSGYDLTLLDEEIWVYVDKAVESESVCACAADSEAE